MRKIISSSRRFIVLIPLPRFGQSESYYDRSYVRMSYVQGDVYVQRGKDIGYEQGEVNLVIVEGDKIGTKDGRAEFQLGRQNILRLDRFTQVDVVSPFPARTRIRPTSIFSPAAFISGSRPWTANGISRSIPPTPRFISLRRGSTGSMSGRIKKPNSASIAVGPKPRARTVRSWSAPESMSSPWTAGSRPNPDRFPPGATSSTIGARPGMLFTPGAPHRPICPQSYSEYENELADNGRWVEESSYGHVWVPSIYDDDWRPYYNGRWDWYPIIGWTWVPYESWGWCTIALRPMGLGGQSRLVLDPAVFLGLGAGLGPLVLGL